MKKYLIAAALIFNNSAAAHELTPTYPKFKQSYIDNVYVTTLNLWNRREDVSYYALEVFDVDWNPLPFATTNRVIKINYLEHKSIELYLHKKDLKNAEFICTTSKMLKKDVISTGITSKICSRIK